ncbi:MAG: lysophospholipid acyltransferase (LPLAT)-like uncharacterized protein [Arenicella sp.]|jgi:lysophospholipid acyltransferase (LPLAT)-like uncharacterized protein
MTLIALTCRVRWHDKENADQFTRINSSVVFGMWHNCSTFSPWAMKGKNLTCMVSASRDGEYIARLAALFGNRTIRGSSSKNSSSATRAVLKLLRAGESIALTPDGPRGPKYSVQPGVVWLAAAAKVPIVPFHIEASRQWRLNSWDNHRFPKPFSTIHIGFGKPVTIDRVLFKQDPEQAAKLVQQAMMDNVNKLKAVAKK